MARRSRNGRGAPSDTAPAAAPRRLPDGATSMFVDGQQQGVPAGVHPQGAAVLRSFHELQRLAAVRTDAGSAGEATVATPAPAYRAPLWEPNS